MEANNKEQTLLTNKPDTIAYIPSFCWRVIKLQVPSEFLCNIIYSTTWRKLNKANSNRASITNYKNTAV